MHDATPRSSLLTGWRAAAASLVLYAVLVAILWFSGPGVPHGSILTRYFTLEGVLECACCLGLATLLMLLPGYSTVKLVCIAGAAAYLNFTSGLQYFLVFFAEPKELIVAICAISVVLVALRGLSVRAFAGFSKSPPSWMTRYDVRQRGVLRAARSTLIWSGLLSVWIATDGQAGDPLGWMRFNLGFVLIFFACECLKYGALADVVMVGDGPSVSRLSQDELHRISLHLRGEEASAGAQDTPEARAKIV